MLYNLNAEQARNGKNDNEMAKLLGIARETYSKKKKSHGFTFFEIRKLCSFFDKPFDYLFATEEEPESEPVQMTSKETQKSVIEKLKRM